jgi:hypothetical protein
LAHFKPDSRLLLFFPFLAVAVVVAVDAAAAVALPALPALPDFVVAEDVATEAAAALTPTFSTERVWIAAALDVTVMPRRTDLC